MTIAEQIKATVTMADILSRYGFEVNSKGFMKCPFHANGQEKTPSLRVKEQSFKCYGCDVNGSVLDFVMHLFGIGFTQAAVRINNDFSLGLTNEKPNSHIVAKMNRERVTAHKEIQDYRTEYMANILLFRAMREIAEQYKPADENIRPIYFLAITEMEYLDYWLEENAWR